MGVNLIAHASNPRVEEDLAIVVAHRCPLVVTSVGSPRRVVDAVHGYGGRVWCDVISLEQARKAAAGGVDGLVLVCAGAGGNTGWINPFAFLKEVRKFYSGIVAVSGSLTDGFQAHALELLDADLAYIGTPFIATHESAASEDYKNAVAIGVLEDIVLSKAASGIPANLLKASLVLLDWIRRPPLRWTWGVDEQCRLVGGPRNRLLRSPTELQAARRAPH